MKKVVNNLKGKNILVAGGTGLVGANLTNKLYELKANILPTYYLRKPLSLAKIYKRFDFTEFRDCIRATKGIDYVFICAALTSGARLMKSDPTTSLLPNLKIIAGLLEACHRNHVEKVILISSSTVYQEAPYPIREDQLDLNKQPYSLYFGVGWMNRYIEQLAKLYYKTYGLQIGIVRPSYIYGPYDNFDDAKSNVVPALIKRALKKEVPYIVWGDGASVRDFIYVEDFIEDLIDVLEKYCIADPINIGSGMALTIREAAKTILEVCKHEIIPQYDKAKPTAIPYRVLDTTKFNSIFGKKKRISFKKGIENTVRWYELTIAR